jgi:hypothetical protein
MLILAGENPAVLSILTNNSEKPSSFLVSVNGYAAKHGRISNNQAKYVPKMVDSFIDQLSKKMGTFPPVTITNITVNNDGRQQTVESVKTSDGKVHQGIGWPTLPAIFENTGLKLPTIRFLVNTNEGTAHKVRLRRLGESSANKGDIGVINNSSYYGRISSRNGDFIPHVTVRKGIVTIPHEVFDAITSLEKDAATFLAENGKMTGICSCCGMPLSDDRSLKAGYGPICAKKWGFPWKDI